MKASSFKRIGAYLIDMLVILLIINVIGGFIPRSDELNRLNKENASFMNEYMEVISKGDLEELEKYSSEMVNISYALGKETIVNSCISIIIYILYFIVFQRYNNGQTIGKKLFSLEVVDKDGNNPSFKSMIIRAVILYNLLFSAVDIILILTLSKSLYLNITDVLSYFQLAITFACFVTLFTNNPLHDRLAGTKVIVFNTVEDVEESNVSKWKKTSKKEQEVKKYRGNHTRGKRKE